MTARFLLARLRDGGALTGGWYLRHTAYRSAFGPLGHNSGPAVPTYPAFIDFQPPRSRGEYRDASLTDWPAGFTFHRSRRPLFRAIR